MGYTGQVTKSNCYRQNFPPVAVVVRVRTAIGVHEATYILRGSMRVAAEAMVI